jgi:hypothetical protein
LVVVKVVVVKAVGMDEVMKEVVVTDVVVKVELKVVATAELKARDVMEAMEEVIMVEDLEIRVVMKEEVL